jgi:hypothetical protein
MMQSYENCIGYLKYTGSLVEEGFLDTRKSAKALLGFDEALRFFLIQEFPDFKDHEFEIPVKIQKGSWEALIPDTIEKWLLTGVGVASTTYLTTAAKKMAENDFKDFSFIRLFREAIKSIQWFIKIGKHVGNLKKKSFERVKWSDGNNEVGIPNEKNEYLYVPKKYLDLYAKTNSNLLAKLADLIEEERCLAIGVVENGEKIEVRLPYSYKYFFTEEDPEIIFPELEHGLPVELEGSTTRGNENSNNIGFRYKDHILTCYPKSGSIVSYKNALFEKCKILGRISREDKNGNIILSRPNIIFHDLIPIAQDNKTLQLF